jgi:hypothetical protein
MNVISQPTQTALFAYDQKGKDAGLSASNGNQLAVFSARAFNRSGGAADVGIVRRYDISSARLYSWDDDVYTPIPLPLEAATEIISDTVDHGFVVQTKTKSGLIGFTVSQAEGGSPEYAYQYWNGSAWATLTVIESVSAFTATDHLIVFVPPHNWAKGGGGALNPNLYSIRVVATTVTSQEVEINNIWAGQIIEFVESVADNSSVEIEFETNHPLILEGGESLMPYFGTANAGNGMRIAYTNV